MFTGIITDLGTVRAVKAGAKSTDTRFEIASVYDMAKVDLGASICCGGACLTVTEKGTGWFAVEVSAETLSRTTLGAWRVGTRINLERSLTLGQELGGHIVTGHVDAVAKVVRIADEGGSTRLTVEVPPKLAKFIAEKGSVAVEGVSLTVNEVEANRFGLNIIRHTKEQTSFGALKVGDNVNVEVDVLARYVARMLKP